jgi:hypothetical protein
MTRMTTLIRLVTSSKVVRTCSAFAAIVLSTYAAPRETSAGRVDLSDVTVYSGTLVIAIVYNGRAEWITDSGPASWLSAEFHRHYQTTFTPYLRNTLSLVTTSRRSACAWAMINRSNGSR